MNSLHEPTEKIQALKKEINKVMLREEMMWNQRSRALWVKCGDQNTKFFHETARKRCRKNRIKGLCDSEGRWREDREEVEGIILDYFKEIYITSYPADFKISLGAVDRRVLDEINDDLLKEFRGEKVWCALKQMHPTKSIGPNGMSLGSDDMSPIFYKKYWDVVVPQVVDCVLKILKTGVMPNGFNDTYICLIPKVNCPQKITDFRPISLCNVIYKMVSKVLANRLKKVLLAVISNAQSTFIPGRQIMDNVLVAFEIMHCIN